jgi:probable H4MPT-linked C1 transfer pathway protein
MASVIGWDIGGAHLKAARAEDGVIVSAAQFACTPHHGLSFLEQAIDKAAAHMGRADRHAVTMTAELSDAFETRAQGVLSVAAIFAGRIKAADISFYAGTNGFISLAKLSQAASGVASANWRASASLLARSLADGLLIDMGSTTTDLIPIKDGAVNAIGQNDFERLAQGELLYTGLVRGNPTAGVSLAPIGGRWLSLVGENFATMADVHRILGDLPEDADMTPTADGRAKTIEASMARLARLVGCDASDADAEQWRGFAAYLARAQMRRIEDQIALLASRDAFAPHATYVGAGVGRELVTRLARTHEKNYRDFEDFIPATREARRAASDCAPAAAVALLLDAGA